MFFHIFLTAVICGISVWLLHSKIKKWYWKTLTFIAVLLTGWFLITTLGFYADSDDGMLKYLTRSPLYLIIGCSIGAWKACRNKENQVNRSKETKKKLRFPKFKFSLDTPFKRVGVIMFFCYLVFVIGAAAVWNFTEKPFFYKTNLWGDGIWKPQAPKPEAESSYGFIRNKENNAWVVTTEECDIDNFKFDISTAKIVDHLTVEEKKELAKRKLERLKKIEACQEGSITFPDELVYRWENSFEDFLTNLFKFWQASVFLLISLLFMSGFADTTLKLAIKAFSSLKEICRWVMRGNT